MSYLKQSFPILIGFTGLVLLGLVFPGNSDLQASSAPAAIESESAHLQDDLAKTTKEIRLLAKDILKDFPPKDKVEKLEKENLKVVLQEARDFFEWAKKIEEDSAQHQVFGLAMSGLLFRTSQELSKDEEANSGSCMTQCWDSHQGCLDNCQTYGCIVRCGVEAGECYAVCMGDIFGWVTNS
ncbi:MAG: hypothetical protein DWQ01_07065 [Planctomycetota bacterium]|nr:MAG: hypothetical protein DWQ01_07065 [Planctomycetota bacterium]